MIIQNLKCVGVFCISVNVDKKRFTYSLMYQSPEKTLTDKDANAIRNKIIKRFDQGSGSETSTLRNFVKRKGRL